MEAARAALIEGAPDAAVRVTEAQARANALRANALEEAVGTLAPQLEDGRAELESVRTAERRADVLDRLEHLAGDGQKYLAEMEGARAEAAAALEPFIVRMVAAFDGLVDTRRAFLDAPRAEAFEAESFIADLQARAVELEAVAVAWSGTPQSTFDKRYPWGRPWPEAGPYAGFVTGAFEGVLAARRAEAQRQWREQDRAARREREAGRTAA